MIILNDRKLFEKLSNKYLELLDYKDFNIIIKLQNYKLQELQKWYNDIVTKYPNKIFDSEGFKKLYMKVNDIDEILGGYNPIGWDKSVYRYLHCNDSFFFIEKWPIGMLIYDAAFKDILRGIFNLINQGVQINKLCGHECL
ncbi:hypothetical protein C2G38_2027900 [Gigaspora rosea]|uniref:Uncharacterized protein n=1 Tax=Gigaspora rosea TaxID=44941 RepID=A0A397W545_9GLOM|nr:hypothetical protein C2G38_2027900 [Gigaspora rosea]